MRVEAYEAVGDRAKLSLHNGGLLTVPLRRVDRVIVDAETAALLPSTEFETRALPARRPSSRLQAGCACHRSQGTAWPRP